LCFLIWFGALIITKVLLLNEYKLGAYDASMALIGAPVVVKTVLIMESRHEYGGFLNTLKSLPENADRFHILVNITVFSDPSCFLISGE